MHQTEELGRIKARIRALAAKTVERGCSEAEAMAAAAKVGELLDIYGLSMTEVALRDELCVQRRMACTGPARTALFWLFPAALRFCECRGWTEGRETLVLFGLEPDVAMAEWLLRVIDGALTFEENRYRRGAEYLARRAPPQAVLRSFRIGFATRVAQRLDGLATERAGHRPPPREASAGTSLVALKQRRLAEELRGLGVRLRTVSRQATVRDRGAYGHGAAAGGRVGLGRPVGEAVGPPALPRR